MAGFHLRGMSREVPFVETQGRLAGVRAGRWVCRSPAGGHKGTVGTGGNENILKLACGGCTPPVNLPKSLSLHLQNVNVMARK